MKGMKESQDPCVIWKKVPLDSDYSRISTFKVTTKKIFKNHV